MQGQYKTIGQRLIYFPPFVNERFGRPPYWSCTFASLLNGANVGWRGAKPATTAEIMALSKASLDPDLKGGSRASHMLKAMRVRYRVDMRLRRLPPERVASRLAHGWAMVAGVTYGDLPAKYRIGTFTGGHRVVLLGWHRDSTFILDPLEDEGPGYTGRQIPWSAFEPAWWSGEQLWFRDGMFLPQPTYGRLEPLASPRAWTAKGGVELDLYSPVRAGVVARRITPPDPVRGTFDARIAELPAEGRGPIVERLRIADGRFRGYYLDPAGRGIRADIDDLAPLAPGKPDADAPKQARQAEADPFLAGRQAEWDRIQGAVGPAVLLPKRPR